MRKILCFVIIAISGLAWARAGATSTFDTVMEHYEPVRTALMADSMEGVAEHGEQILAALRSLKAEFSAENAGIAADDGAKIAEKIPAMIAAARSLAGATRLAEAREALYALSKPMVHWREALTSSDRPAVAYCPMHKKSWLQEGVEIGNPYGDMPRCGSIVSE